MILHVFAAKQTRKYHLNLGTNNVLHGESWTVVNKDRQHKRQACLRKKIALYSVVLRPIKHVKKGLVKFAVYAAVIS